MCAVILPARVRPRDRPGANCEVAGEARSRRGVVGVRGERRVFRPYRAGNRTSDWPRRYSPVPTCRSTDDRTNSGPSLLAYKTNPSTVPAPNNSHRQRTRPVLHPSPFRSLVGRGSQHTPRVRLNDASGSRMRLRIGRYRAKQHDTHTHRRRLPPARPVISQDTGMREPGFQWSCSR